MILDLFIINIYVLIGDIGYILVNITYLIVLAH